jgi:hypothetical protein
LKEQFYCKLVDFLFCSIENKKFNSLKKIKQKVTEILDEAISIYAGAEHYVGEWYITNSNEELKKISLNIKKFSNWYYNKYIYIYI